ncbi:50S ribosomal protein L23 [Candidatus Photodesmus katoptron]|uniref:Large ribosomal subunit protein uL23 n=1 Tax=Candidatus Photodesmus katoptron Akat1 TaxID=1236703 RepID=S3DHQ6_9GAMM|nr:50S ribosomal protein L23 [Candidatus Photodesmus katoptron]EPE37215.1 ribosomal protein L23 [Candidatus Photodesmus katoptron Akat1]KEY90130.1 50S ribosomal protein L23 [Candidatus Photodesmus katoptron]
MITEERILNVIRFPHISEKATIAGEKFGTIVFKVAKDSTKKEIKLAVEELFKVKVRCVNTLIIKGKRKRQGRRIDVKKAYVLLEKGQDIDFTSSAAK